MSISFFDINPYEVLEVSKDSTPLEIKKSYKKLCLKYHPDKIQQHQTDNDKSIFPKIQFAYSVLSDSARRLRYDKMGVLSESDVDDTFNWQDYFDSMNNKITIDMIEEDRVKYQGSEEERRDVVENFVFYDGDFLKLFELIPHLEFTESEEARIFDLIEKEMENDEFCSSLDKSVVKSWEKYKKSRKTKVRQMLKRLAKEAKEADELAKMIKDKGKRNLGKDDDLKSLIKSRQTNRLDSLINSLESKYVNKSSKKRSAADLTDDEFNKIQKSMFSNPKSKKSKQ